MADSFAMATDIVSYTADEVTIQKTGSQFALKLLSVTAAYIADATLTLAKFAVGTVKGQQWIWNGSSWELSGVATRATNLPDSDVSVTVSEGNRFVLAAATLGASRNLTLSIAGPPSITEVIVVERRDVTANTYVVKNSVGTVLYTFPAGSKRMASFLYTGEWALAGNWAII